MNKTLSDFERKAIDSIFNEAEQEHISSDQIMQNIFLLDQRSKEIWDDWDDAVTACMKGDISSQFINHENISHSTVLDSEENKYTQSSRKSKKSVLNIINDDDSTSDFKYTADISKDTDFYNSPPTKNRSFAKKKVNNTSNYNFVSQDSYVADKDNSPLRHEKRISKYNTSQLNGLKKSSKKKPTKGDTEISTYKEPAIREKTYSKHSRKATIIGKKSNIDDHSSISSKSSVEPYNRGDAARLRQENLDLRNQIRRVQASLNRAIIEKERLLEDYEKSERISAKQRNQINFFKGSK